MQLMQKLFGRICMDEMSDGGAGSGGDTSSSESSSADTSTSAETGGSSSEPAGDGPNTMLEAISQSLEKKEEPTANADPKAEQKDDGAPGKPKPTVKQADGQVKPGDEDLHKLPEGLSPRAQERFHKMSEKIKETTTHLASLGQALEATKTELEDARAVRDSFRNFYTTTGTNPQQLNEVAAYLKASNSGDTQTEVNMLLSRLRDIQVQTGRPIEGLNEMADPLQQFPDLAQAVASYQMTREVAMELASARSMQQNMQQSQQQQSQRQSEIGSWMEGKSQASRGLQSWEKQMAASDPDYAQIAPLVMGNVEAMKHIIENTPPATWQNQVAMLYNQTKAAVQKFRPAQGSAPRPLSGSGARPQGATPKASSMFEAMFPNG